MLPGPAFFYVCSGGWTRLLPLPVSTLPLAVFPALPHQGFWLQFSSVNYGIEDACYWKSAL